MLELGPLAAELVVVWPVQWPSGDAWAALEAVEKAGEVEETLVLS